jgi:hypothetical protein
MDQRLGTNDDGVRKSNQLCVEFGQPRLSRIVEDEHSVNHGLVGTKFVYWMALQRATGPTVGGGLRGEGPCSRASLEPGTLASLVSVY